MENIRLTQIRNAERLIPWRMEVMAEMFGKTSGELTGKLHEATTRYYARHLADGSHVACTSSVNGTEAGCAAMYFSEELPSPDNPSGRCAYLTNVYVRPAFRHRGVATIMVRWLIEMARSRGIERVFLETPDSAHRIYSPSGFHRMPDMMIYKNPA